MSLAYETTGYIVAETRSTDGSGNMTLVHRATRADGSLASETTTVTSASGLSRTISFDRDGDGVLDEVQTEVTVINGDGSRTKTLSVFDGSSTILARREVTTTSADGKTVSIARDLDGSGNTDETEVRAWDSSGNLTLTVTHLNADGSTNDEVTTVTSASGLSKTRQLEFTGSGAINATETTATSVDGSGTRRGPSCRADAPSSALERRRAKRRRPSGISPALSRTRRRRYSAAVCWPAPKRFSI